MRYRHNKGVTFSGIELLLITVLVSVLITASLILMNNKFGVIILQKVIAG